MTASLVDVVDAATADVEEMAFEGKERLGDFDFRRPFRVCHVTPSFETGWVEAPGGAAMQGTITRKEVLLHWVTIVRLWGARCYLRSLRAAMGRGPSTFLGVVTECNQIDGG